MYFRVTLPHPPTNVMMCGMVVAIFFRKNEATNRGAKIFIRYHKYFEKIYMYSGVHFSKRAETDP